MTSNSPTPKGRPAAPGDPPALEPSIIRRIEQALYRVGDFGEIRLIVVKGQLRFIQIMQSENLYDIER